MLQQQISQFQEKASQLEVTGEAGGGLVTLKLNGEGDLKAIRIKPECVDPEDVEGLELLIKTAHANAKKQLQENTPSELMNLSGPF